MTPTAAPGRPVLGLLRHEWALIVVALAVATLPAVMPAMVGVLADQRGLGVERAGYVVAMNMGGIFAGTVTCAWLSRRIAWHRLLVGGLAVMVAGNTWTVLGTSDAALLASRVGSGLGEGVAGAVCYALMGRSTLPARSLAFYVAGQGAIGSIGMALLPSLVAGLGWHVFYAAVSLLALPGMALASIAARNAPAVPVPVVRTGASVPASSSTARAGWGVLAAIFVVFAGMAAMWAFLQPIGHAHGLQTVQIAAALSASAIAGLAGSLAAGLVASRFATVPGAAIGLAVALAGVVGVWAGSPAAFFVGACALNFAWAFEFPFLFRCLADEDAAGRIAVLTPAATGGALTVGPAIGGFVLQHAGVGVLAAVCAAAVTLGTAVVAVVDARRRGDAAAALAHLV